MLLVALVMLLGPLGIGPLLVLLSRPPLFVMFELESPVGSTPYCEGACLLVLFVALVALLATTGSPPTGNTPYCAGADMRLVPLVVFEPE